VNFLLNPIGSIGDVNPYLAIGLMLQERGHRVRVIANPYFEPLIRKVGLDFVALGTIADVEDFWRIPDMWHTRRFWKSSLQYSALLPMRQSYELIAERYIPGETVVAGPAWAFGARCAQDKLGVPMATVLLEPDKLRSLYRSPVMPPPLVLSDWVPRISKRFQLWIADRFFIDRVVGAETNAFRKELGLPPVKRLLADWWLSPQRIIGLFPDWFASPQPDWPKHAALTGFPLWDQSGVVEVPKDLAEYLSQGEKPIVFTFGTANQHARQFFATAAESCRRLGRRAILIAKDREQLPEVLPEGVRHFSYVPFSHLLHESAALVHHAGAGTIAQCLAAGIPQVTVPISFSQPDMAAHLVRLGVGVAFKLRTFRGPAVARALDHLLTSPQVAARCRELAANFEDVQPLERTCELLEELVGSDRRR